MHRHVGPLSMVKILIIIGMVVTVTGSYARGSTLSASTTASAAPAGKPSTPPQPSPKIVKPSTPPQPSPKVGPPDPQPLDPPDTGPLPLPIDVARVLSGAQVGAVQIPFDTRLFTVTSFYEFVPTTYYLELAAGSQTSSPDQGVLRVLELGPRTSDVSYTTRAATGPLTIVAVTGQTVSLTSSTGVAYTFDVATRAFR